MYVSESCYFLRTCRKRSKQKDPFLLNSANLRFSLLLPSQSPHPHLLVWSKSFFAHFAFICSFLFAKRKRKKKLLQTLSCIHIQHFCCDGVFYEMLGALIRNRTLDLFENLVSTEDGGRKRKRLQVSFLIMVANVLLVRSLFSVNLMKSL